MYVLKIPRHCVAMSSRNTSRYSDALVGALSVASIFVSSLWYVDAAATSSWIHTDLSRVWGRAAFALGYTHEALVGALSVASISVSSIWHVGATATSSWIHTNLSLVWGRAAFALNYTHEALVGAPSVALSLHREEMRSALCRCSANSKLGTPQFESSMGSMFKGADSIDVSSRFWLYFWHSFESYRH